MKKTYHLPEKLHLTAPVELVEVKDRLAAAQTVVVDVVTEEC